MSRLVTRFYTKEPGKEAERLMVESFTKAETVTATYNYELATVLRFVSRGHSHEDDCTYFWGTFIDEDQDRIWMVRLITPGQA